MLSQTTDNTRLIVPSDALRCVVRMRSAAPGAAGSLVIVKIVVVLLKLLYQPCYTGGIRIGVFRDSREGLDKMYTIETETVICCRPALSPTKIARGRDGNDARKGRDMRKDNKIRVRLDIGPARYEGWGQLVRTMTPGNIPEFRYRYLLQAVPSHILSESSRVASVGILCML